MGEEIKYYIDLLNYYKPAINKFLSDNGLTYPEFSDTITAVKLYVVRRVDVTRKSGMEVGNETLYKWLTDDYTKKVDTKK